jgi:hypothetical protein
LCRGLSLKSFREHALLEAGRMDACQLLFWKPGSSMKLPAAAIARELVWGEEVDGLIDLPVRDIIDRLKAEYPQHEEQTGVLIGRTGAGWFEATWTWQHIQVKCHDLPADNRRRLIETIESFDCMAYETASQ